VSRRDSILAEGREAADTIPEHDGRVTLSTRQVTFRSVSDLAATSSVGGVPIATDKVSPQTAIRIKTAAAWPLSWSNCKRT